MDGTKNDNKQKTDTDDETLYEQKGWNIPHWTIRSAVNYRFASLPINRLY